MRTRGCSSIVGLTLPWLAGAVALAGGTEEAVPEPVYMGRAFVFEVDVERGRELGWSSPELSPQAVLERVARSLETRLRRSGKFVEAVVQPEGANRLAAIFIGPQWRAFEELIQQGLSGGGRIAFEVEATAAERTACEDGSATASRCKDLVARRWRGAADGAPVVVFEAPSHLLQPHTAERLEIVATTTGSRALRIHLDEEGWEDLAAFRAVVEGHELALTLDGEVLAEGIEPSSLERSLIVDGGFTLDELRPVVFAFAGEPLPAPLRFVGTAERELPNVKHRDSPTAID